MKTPDERICSIVNKVIPLAENFVRHNPLGKEEDPQKLFEAFMRFLLAIEMHEVQKGR